MVAGAVSGLFGVAADTPAPDAGWRRERQEQSDSDPISGLLSFIFQTKLGSDVANVEFSRN